MAERAPLRVRENLREPEAKRRLTDALFGTLAASYDATNRLLSLGRDAVWKRALVAALPALERPVCLDLACGTGDLTRALAERYPRGRTIGLDQNAPMLDRARTRCAGRANIEFLRADMAQTGLPDGAVDVVTGGYALRNSAELGPALDEIARVLRPGGTAAFLDFSRPVSPAGQGISGFLLTLWCGFWGLVLHRRPELYTYIAKSMMVMPDRRQLRRMLEARGLRVTSSRLHYFGILETIFVVRAPASWRRP